MSQQAPPGDNPAPSGSGTDGGGPAGAELSAIVVGKGAAGTLVTIELLNEAMQRRIPLSITWIGEGPPGRGVAYSTPSPWHRLNVPSDRIFGDGRSDDFRTWLAARGADADEYASRWDLGTYLADQLHGARRAAGQFARLDEIQRRAVALTTDHSGVHIEIDDRTQVSADRAVLALGLLPPAPPPGLTPAATSHPRLVADPWNGALDHVHGSGDAVLVGTGLTMVDVALTLSRQAPDLRMHAVSRTGLIPCGHRPGPNDSLPPAVAPRVDLSLERLVAEVEQAAAGASDWREVVDGLRPATQDLWRSLSRPDQERFLAEHARRWEVHRHRMAPSVAEELTALRTVGDLRFSASPVRAIETDGGRLLVRLRDVDLPADWVINCTGPHLDPAAAHDPLIRSLLSTGNARPHPLGLGFDTTAPGALVTADGPSDRLFTLGSPRRGELYETTALAEIADQAEQLAEVFLKSTD